MRFSHLVSLAFSVTLALALYDTARSAVTLPEYVGEFAGVVGGRSVPLERANDTGTNATMLKGALAFGQSKIWAIAKGEKSPVRFKQSSDISFLTRVATNTADPNEYIVLWKMKLDGANRIKDIMFVFNANGKMSKDLTREDTVPISFRKIGEYNFSISTSNSLPVGEYCLRNNSSPNMYCFGVDP